LLSRVRSKAEWLQGALRCRRRSRPAIEPIGQREKEWCLCKSIF
jgi:hypothetical protein